MIPHRLISTSVPAKLGMVKTIRSVFAGLFASCLAAPTAADDVLVPISPLQERWGEPQYNGVRFPALKVSGAGPAELANVLIPAELAGREICLSVNAANDWYTARQTFKVADDWPGGLAGTTLASDYDEPPRDIFEVPAGDGLTRFAVGECDRIGPDLTLLLSAWQEEPRGTVTSIYVLAQRSERVAAELEGKGVEVTCTEDAETSGRYTHRCDFDTRRLTPGANIVNVYVFGTRAIGGRPEEILERVDSLTVLAEPGIAP